MGTSIVFTSGKGGTGKSTAVSAIASCLAALGKQVLCVDMDLRLPNLDLLLGMSDLSALDISDVAQGRNTFEEAVVAHPTIQGLWFLAGPATFSGDMEGRENLPAIVEEAKARFDYCLIDAPAGIDELFYLTAQGADMAVVVATTDITSQRDVQRAVMELDAAGMTDIRMILNRVRIKQFSRSSYNVDDVIDFVGVPLLGIVPEDKDVLTAGFYLRPLVLHSRKLAASAFLRIAKRITGEDIPLRHR